ncbi:hypothetical protein F5888DRAFT_1262224 [Russula emetica]|nr:hypothetical protein F5888DRAFT_1262224 [Russula emetica]
MMVLALPFLSFSPLSFSFLFVRSKKSGSSPINRPKKKKLYDTERRLINFYFVCKGESWRNSLKWEDTINRRKAFFFWRVGRSVPAHVRGSSSHHFLHGSS